MQQISMAMVPNVLKYVALAEREPVIFCNDDFQSWHDSWRELLAYTAREGLPPASRLIDMLYPEDDDIVLLKSRHSAFYHTQLVPLLEHLGIQELCIAGAATDACVLCTAIDAHVRGYRVTIASDAVASASGERQQRALAQMGDSLGLRIARGETWLAAAEAD